MTVRELIKKLEDGLDASGLGDKRAYIHHRDHNNNLVAVMDIKNVATYAGAVILEVYKQ